MSLEQKQDRTREWPSHSQRPLRTRMLIAFGLAVVLLAAGAYFVAGPRAPRPLAVAVVGLDPEVAKLIQSALDEMRRAPRSGAAWGKVGSVLIHYEFIEETRRAFQQAEKLSPQDPRWPYLHAILLMTHDSAAAVPKLERAADLARDRPDVARLRLAQFLAERGRGDEAEKQFQALLRLRPDHPLALLGLARLNQTRGRFQESTNLLARCLHDPHTAKSAHAFLATAQRALGNAPAAEAAAYRSLSLPADLPWPDPFWDEAAAYRVGRKARIEDATALLDQGQFAEALTIFSGVARDYPEDDEAWYLMGWAHNRQQRPAEAERALREHLRRSPRSPKGHAQLAVALLSQRRHAEALKVLEAAVKLKTTWRELHYNLGYACAQLGRVDEAIGHLRNALAQDPNYLPTYTALAELLLQRGEREEAGRLIRQALDLDPSDPRAQALLLRVERGPN
jgi:tetratricopeptide (TPR) repeat protein